MENLAIEIKNVHVNYRLLKKQSLKKTLLTFKNHKISKKEALKGISFTVEKGEIIGVIGDNGSGKSTLLRTIAGIISPDEGNVNLKNNTVSLLALGVGFNEELTGYENIFLSGMLLGMTKEAVKEKIQEIVEFSELEEDIDKPVRTYSSGMRSKLAFSITAILETDIILIDEVLSVGDIKFKEKSFNKMKELILDKNKTVLIVSHDINILEDICNRVIWIEDGKIKKIGNTKETIEEYKKEINN